MVPERVVVTVAVDSVELGAVVVLPDPAFGDEAELLMVTVAVTCEARLLASFSAFLNAEAGIGTPAN